MIDVTLYILDAVKKPLAQVRAIEFIIGPPADDAHTVSVFYQPCDHSSTKMTLPQE